MTLSGQHGAPSRQALISPTLLLLLLDIRRPHLDQPPFRPVQPHRVPPAGEEVASLGIPLAAAEVDGGAACPVEGRGVEAAKDHAKAEEGGVLLDVVVEALEVAGRVLDIASCHCHLEQPQGLGVALVDAPSVTVAHPQVGGSFGVALSCAELEELEGALVALRHAASVPIADPDVGLAASMALQCGLPEQLERAAIVLAAP